MAPESIKTLIDTFAADGERLMTATRGLTRTELLAIPDANAGVGKWSIQQVLVHLQDSDRIAIDRMQRIIAEENPTLIGYDENKAAAALFMDEQSAEDATVIFNLSRRQFARVLRKLPPTAFDRTGTHNERGAVSLGGMLRDYINHFEKHLGFIQKKLAVMSKRQ